MGKEFKTKKDNKNLGILYTSKGKLELILEKNDLAHESFMKAEYYSRKVNDYLNLGYIYFSLAEYQIRLKSYQKAIVMLDNAKENFLKVNSSLNNDLIILKKLEITILQNNFELANQI